MTCREIDRGFICGPSAWVELSRQRDQVRWCFACRQHTPHDLIVEGEPPEAMSYYEPNPRLDCSVCHEDHTDFPGTSRDWATA